MNLKNTLACCLLGIMLIISACGTNISIVEENIPDPEEIVEMLPEETEKVESSQTVNDSYIEDVAVNDAVEAAETLNSTDDSSDFFASPKVSGKLSVSGTNIIDENGNIVQLKGISTHGIAWFPDYINNELFSEFKNEWNMNVVRLAMYTYENGGYCSDGNKTKLLSLIDDGVKYATENDLYVIIDWHVLNDRDPNTYKSEAIDFFKKVSALYADHNNVIYEICNEPNGNVLWSSIKSYALDVIPVIRENDSDAIIIVGTPTWSQEVDKAADDPITGYDNIMYALHFYADTHRDDLRKKLENAEKKGLPIFVTEYGICDASGSGNINETEAAKWMSLLNEYNISSCMWNLSNKNETSSIILSSCNKTSGFTESDLSGSGKWLYNMLTGKTIFEASVSNSSEATDDNSNASHETVTSSQVSNNLSLKTLTEESNGIKITLTPTNSWESEGSTFVQYAITVENTGTSVSSWSIELGLEGTATLSQGWCASFSVQGSRLTVSNAEWNGSLDGGASVTDAGVILAY